ncbi:MAG: DUF4271 domain-containing protein [Flavobacteriales bacterium]|nr:DUF4271 domain-containing protein [Flavobacteriales bacterium]
MRSNLLFWFFLGLSLILGHSLSYGQDPDSGQMVVLAVDSLELAVADSSLIRSDTLQLDSVNFAESEPMPEREEALIRKKRTETWVLFVVIFIMILIGVMRALDSNRYYYSLRTPFRSYRSEQGFNDLIPGIDLFQAGLILIYSLVLGFGLYIYQPFGLNPNLDAGWRNFLVLVIGIGVLYTLKYALYYLIFQILQSERLPGMIVVSMSNLAFVFALLALPALLIVYYSLNDILRAYLGNALVIMSLIFVSYRFFRIIFITWPGFTLGRVYVILYLCTLEILPLLILARWAGLLG